MKLCLSGEFETAFNTFTEDGVCLSAWTPCNQQPGNWSLKHKMVRAVDDQLSHLF